MIAIKARLKPNLTAKENKSLQEEIRRQCVENTRKYEEDIDTVTLYVLHEVFGFGASRLNRFYEEMFRLRDQMQKRYQSNDMENGIAEYAMREKLERDGIDVHNMFESQQKRFYAVLKK